MIAASAKSGASVTSATTGTSSARDRVALSVRELSLQYGDGCKSCTGADNGAGADSGTGADSGALEKNYCPTCGTVYAVQSSSFDLFDGEVLGIVGESGSGKSSILNCLYFDQLPTSGAAYLALYEDGLANIFEGSAQVRRDVRNRLLGKVYQNPMLGLKMQFSSVSNVAEKMIAAGYRNVGAIEDRARDLLDHTRIPRHRVREAPRNFSGGMQQRVQIAKALSNQPPVLLLDEVTTGLDLSVQAAVLDLIKQIQRELAVSMLLVSHDLGVVRMLAERTIVMLNGRIVEQGLTDQILEDPQHPYTQELVYSLL